jgi:hypothetical protein
MAITTITTKIRVERAPASKRLDIKFSGSKGVLKALLVEALEKLTVPHIKDEITEFPRKARIDIGVSSFANNKRTENPISLNVWVNRNLGMAIGDTSVRAVQLHEAVARAEIYLFLCARNSAHAEQHQKNPIHMVESRVRAPCSC